MVKHDKEKTEKSAEKENINSAEKAQETPDTDKNVKDETPSDESTANEPEASEQEPAADEKDVMIKKLKEKHDELNDRYLRLFSEFDNYRKRTIKEKQELTKTASADIIEAILPIVDDLERAYKSAIENPETETLTEGLNLIQSKIKTTLKHKGLEEIPSIGEIFNTDFHEAITHIPAQDEKDKGKVVDEVQKGYLLNGKVLRFAKVVVAN